MSDPVARSRISDQTSLQSATYTTYSGPGCTSTAQSINGSRIGTYLKMDDWVVPNFRNRSNAGEVFNNPMSRVKYTFYGKIGGGGWGHYYPPFICATQSGVWKGISTNYLTQRLGAMGFTPPTPTIATDSLISEAATMALSNVKSPNVQGLVFVAEIQQTIDLLRNPISALTTYFKKHKGGRDKYENRAREVTGASNAASSQYLAVVFGALPLMHDIEGLLEALVRTANMRETARGQVQESKTITTNNLPLSTGFVTGTYKTECVETVLVRAGAMYAFTAESLTGSLGMSLKDIPAAMWEHLPWSFLIDWFSNVGKVIDAVMASCTNDFLAQWVTVKRSQYVVRTATGTTTTAPWVQTISCSDADACLYETFSRAPTNLSQQIGLHLNFSLSRVPTLTALSLLIQQLTKGK